MARFTMNEKVGYSNSRNRLVEAKIINFDGSKYLIEVKPEFKGDDGLREASGRELCKLEEANGSVDKLYSTFDRAIVSVEKVISAILDSCDILDDIMLESIALGGKIAEIVPSNIKTLMSEMANIANNDLKGIIEGGQSSLKSLKDVVGNMPYRDIQPQTKAERRDEIFAQPNLAAGPQSQIMHESLEDFYKTSLMAQASSDHYTESSLRFDKLTESKILGQGDMDTLFKGEIISLVKPDTKKITETMRKNLDNKSVSLTESYEGDSLNFSQLTSVGGFDGLPTDFSTLKLLD